MRKYKNLVSLLPELISRYQQRFSQPFKTRKYAYSYIFLQKTVIRFFVDKIQIFIVFNACCFLYLQKSFFHTKLFFVLLAAKCMNAGCNYLSFCFGSVFKNTFSESPFKRFVF